MSPGTARASGVLAWLWAVVAVAAIHALFAALQPWFLRVAAYDGQWTVAHVAADLVELGDARPDVIFLGSSRAATGFDPGVIEREIARSTGTVIRAVNLAVTGATADTSRLVLKNLVGDDRRPRIAIYAVYELEMLASPNDVRVRQDLPYLSSIERLDDLADYARAPWQTRAWFVAEQILPIERDRRLVRDALEIALTAGPAHDLYAAGAAPPGERGFHRVPVDVSDPDPDRARREYAAALARPRFSEAAALRLERLLDLARDRGIDAILVDLPVSARHRSFWKHENLERYRASLADIAARHQVAFLDLYENPGDLVPERGFTDTHHLNELGAAIVSRELVDRMLAARFARPRTPTS